VKKKNVVKKKLTGQKRQLKKHTILAVHALDDDDKNDSANGDDDDRSMNPSMNTGHGEAEEEEEENYDFLDEEDDWGLSASKMRFEETLACEDLEELRSFAEKFIEDYDDKVSELGNELEKEEEEKFASKIASFFPTYGRKHGYYLSSYGYSKALLHQSMRILASQRILFHNNNIDDINFESPHHLLEPERRGDHLLLDRMMMMKQEEEDLVKGSGETTKSGNRLRLNIFGCFPGVVLTRMNYHLKHEVFENGGGTDNQGNKVTSLKTPKDGSKIIVYLATANLNKLENGRLYFPNKELVEDGWWQEP